MSFSLTFSFTCYSSLALLVFLVLAADDVDVTFAADGLFCLWEGG